MKPGPVLNSGQRAKQLAAALVAAEAEEVVAAAEHSFAATVAASAAASFAGDQHNCYSVEGASKADETAETQDLAARIRAPVLAGIAAEAVAVGLEADVAVAVLPEELDHEER
jgi:hypothetical protein